tara:strand:- start:1423 stop:2676 length:1254 start_codon:yes stop_codon:yes gene_type:complete
MQVGVIGLGKLGCSMLAAFSTGGNKVYGYDIIEKVRNKLRNAIAPVSETNLQAEIEQGFNNYKILETAKEVLELCDITYLIVPTPSLSDGTFDTKYLEDVIQELSTTKADCRNKVLVITSTVLPGDTRHKLKTIASSCGEPFSLINFVYSPEFIALGSVLNDLKNPDFLLVGEDSSKSGDLHIEVMKSIINNKDIPIRRMSIESAEMAKIAINSYITCKISFANAIGFASDSIENCNSTDVINAIGSDRRIGKNYLSKGLGFGGPCFPRDNRAIQQVINKTKDIENYNIPINTEKFNKSIPDYYVKKISDFCSLKNIKRIVVIGITYKDGSFLLEESQSYDIALKLSSKFIVNYYDTDVEESNIKEIAALNEKSNINECVLILNCSRIEEKFIQAKKILLEKATSIYEYHVWPRNTI